MTAQPRTALPYFFSASQVETFMSCPRKWGWKYIARIAPTQANSAQVGDAGHKELETHLGGGAIDFTKVIHGVRIGDVIAPGLGLLPAPCAAGMRIETSFNFPSNRGPWTWTGRKDIECDDGAVFPVVEGQPDVPAGCPVVSDHKTTSDLKWAKTPDALEWDVQANLYAYELLHFGACKVHEDCKADEGLARACFAAKQPHAVDLVWTYYQTRGAKKSKRVHLRVLREHADEAFARIETIAKDMAKHHDQAACEFDKGAYVQSMPPNPTQCDAYGGCPYQGECQLTITERFSASMSNDSGFFSNLANVAAAQDAAAPAPQQPAVPETLPAWATAPVDPLKAMQAAPAPMVMPSGPVGTTLPIGLPAGLTGAPPVINDVPVNPPESTLPPLAQPAATMLPPVWTPAASAPPSIVETLAEEKPKRKPGRPKGSTKAVEPNAIIHNVPQATEPAQPLTIVVNLPAADSAPAPEQPTQAPATERVQRNEAQPYFYALYVDCLPDGGEFTYADDLIDLANAIVVQRASTSEKPVAHYKFLDYGKGAGALDIALQQVLAEQKPKAVFCSGTSDAMPTLTKRAGRITRSVR